MSHPAPTVPLSAQIAVLTGPQSLPTLAVIAVRFAVLVIKWDNRKRSRRVLDRLTSHELKDIGLTRKAASKEASKHFWQD